MHEEVDTDILLEQAAAGDYAAREQVLSRHRSRLRRMIEIRKDPRVEARFDPSDVVQMSLVTAAKRLDEYLENQPLPFYPWLRHLAWEQLLQLHRVHIRSKKRSVAKEELGINTGSACELANELARSDENPYQQVLKDETLKRIRNALDELPVSDREVLVLRYLEQLSTRETAEALGISISAAKARHFRAIRRIHGLLK